MPVQRAWVDSNGNIKLKLTNQEMSQFLSKVVSGLVDLAQSKVIEEMNEDRPAKATGKVVANV